jgi:hypothetical protein
MRCECFAVLLMLLALLSSFSMGYAQQSSNCVVIDKRDTTVIVSCADGTTQNLNIGGASGLYRPGDRIDIGSQTPSSNLGPSTPGVTVGPRVPGVR